MSQPPTEYYQLPRHEVARLVPQESRRILEIGPGFGSLGRELSARRGVTIDAVEINPAAAEYLSGTYRTYVIGDIQADEVRAQFPGPYDCVVCADVLEHLVNPWLTLRQLASVMRPGGSLVISIPNIRNLAPLSRLVLYGEWEYGDSGFLDRTHLRFFTRKSVQTLVSSAGLEIEHWDANRDSYTGLRGFASRIMRMISPDFAVCQFLVVARKR